MESLASTHDLKANSEGLQSPSLGLTRTDGLCSCPAHSSVTLKGQLIRHLCWGAFLAPWGS